MKRLRLLAGLALLLCVGASHHHLRAGTPTHVQTAVYLYKSGAGGVPSTYSLAQIAPYVTWAGNVRSALAPTVAAAGIKPYSYVNFYRNRANQIPGVWYTDLAPGGAHAAAEARDCNGSPIHDTFTAGVTGYLADPRNATATLGHAQVVIASGNAAAAGYAATFVDDIDSQTSLSGTPCGYSLPAWILASNAVHAQLRLPLIVNALAVADPRTMLGYIAPANVIAAMCEACYSYYNYNLTTSKVQAAPRWTYIEDAQLAMAAQHKSFWVYTKPLIDPAAATRQRLYAYASFLLGNGSAEGVYEAAFDPRYTSFPVMPEVGLVCAGPQMPVTHIADLLVNGVYAQWWSNCSLWGDPVGAVAAVLNASATLAYGVPTRYLSGHALALSGEDVLHGGRATFSGTVPISLPPGSAAIIALANAPAPSPAPSAVVTVAGTIVWISTSATKFQIRQSNGQLLYVYETAQTALPTAALSPKVGYWLTASGAVLANPFYARSISWSATVP